MRDQLNHLIARLRHQARLDPVLDNALQMLESAEIQITEAASELGGYAQAIDLDPERLALVETRVSDMFQLARKLRCEPEELLTAAAELQSRLTELERAQDIEALTERVAELAAQFDALAGQLSTVRRKAASTLTEAVNAQITGLGMPNARFDIEIETGEPGPFGVDRIAFLFAGHQSMTPRSLARVASGGELSRVSLAIAVSAAQANPVDSLIFDEADAGVGGAVADAIGHMMRRLGESRQVLAVTHLPQVAACAHQHFRISKSDNGGALNSQVTLLDDQARIEELARMLGGSSITATTREHAGELIALARSNGSGTATGASQARPAPRRKANHSPKATGKRPVAEQAQAPDQATSPTMTAAVTTSNSPAETAGPTTAKKATASKKTTASRKATTAKKTTAAKKTTGAAKTSTARKKAHSEKATTAKKVPSAKKAAGATPSPARNTTPKKTGTSKRARKNPAKA